MVQTDNTDSVPGQMRTPGGLSENARLYVSRQASNPWRYLWEQTIMTAAGWIPTVAGIAARNLLYRAIMHLEGSVAVEQHVRLRFADHIRLGQGVYLDEGVYLHASPQGITIGAGTFVMHHAVLHVYNFRGIPNAGISIGRDSLIGEMSVIRGQGGVTIGDRVYLSPLVQILAVNHVFADTERPFVEQGITAEGIIVEDDVWIGGGAVLTDGVHVGRGAVIAGGAVVTQDVQPHTVVAGVPARLVRDLRTNPVEVPADKKVWL